MYRDGTLEKLLMTFLSKIIKPTKDEKWLSNNHFQVHFSTTISLNTSDQIFTKTILKAPTPNSMWRI